MDRREKVLWCLVELLLKVSGQNDNIRVVWKRFWMLDSRS